jgi:polyisoprenoid-binding protein YceI
VAAALRHAVNFKDGVMLRMVPRVLKAWAVLILPFALMAVLTASAPPAAAQEWATNKNKSRLTFEVDAGGKVVTGEFEQFRAEIHFDPDYLEIAEIAAAIDTNTISTGYPKVDAGLMNREWFDTQTYPSAGFRAKSVMAGDADGSYIMEGELTIKGNTRPVTIPFSLAIDQGEATVTGETAISRSDFGIGPNGPVSGVVIGDIVKIRLDLVATRLDN